uniref:PPM-type phosphatase domain-containing protein n=1 Tax=Salix viminalis TaxID=40686 RepID=A0A6N2KTL7_SALVM
MGHLSSMFSGLARSFSLKKVKNNGNGEGREAADAMVKDAKKNEMILRSSGCVNVDGSKNFAAVCSRRGEKGVNQDCCIVWEGFGCQADMVFCGIFDGHGSWGHFVAKKVRDSMPPSLLCNWQETLAQRSQDPDMDLESDKKNQSFNIWKHSYLKTCSAVDQELGQHRKIDSFSSGTTALTVVRQGELIFVANVGDSRAVLATTGDDGSLVPVQLTVDFKPNLPRKFHPTTPFLKTKQPKLAILTAAFISFAEEAERILQCNGRVFCLNDEPGVHRVWLPDADSPGLAMSRAFGDYCVKDFGLISVPEVTQMRITSKDQFVVLATDGVWDVISNQEAVQIVSSATDKAKAAKRLVQSAVQAWKRKRKGIAMDDISAICLFFHSSPSSLQVHPATTPK